MIARESEIEKASSRAWEIRDLGKSWPPPAAGLSYSNSTSPAEKAAAFWPGRYVLRICTCMPCRGWLSLSQLRYDAMLNAPMLYSLCSMLEKVIEAVESGEYGGFPRAEASSDERDGLDSLLSLFCTL
jgi:hypothetical protein